MGSIKVQGSLLGGPSDGGSFPTAQFNAQLSLKNATKGYNAATGVLTRNVQSPNAFVALSAIGGGADVPEADFFYMKSNSDFAVRITLKDGVGGTTVVVVPVSGLFMFEPQSQKAIVSVEVQGSGPIEYFASGNA